MRKFNYQFTASQSSEDVLFSSSIGELKEQKLILFLPKKRELMLREIAFFELKEQQEYVLNITMGLMGFVFFVLGFFSEIIYFLIPSLLFFSIALFINRTKFYVLIILRNPEKIFIKIPKKDVLNIKHFIKKVNDSINTTPIIKMY